MSDTAPPPPPVLAHQQLISYIYTLIGKIERYEYKYISESKTFVSFLEEGVKKMDEVVRNIFKYREREKVGWGACKRDRERERERDNEIEKLI